MNNWRLKNKLLLAFGIISFITLLEAVTVWRNVREIDKRLEGIVSTMIPQADRVNSLQLTVIRASLETRHAMLMRTPEKREATFAEITRLQSEAKRLVNEIGQNIRTEEGKRRFQALRQTEASFWSEAGQTLPLIQADRIDESVERLESRIIPARNAFLKDIQNQIDWQQRLVNDTATGALATATRTEWLVAVIALLTAALGLVAAVVMARHLMKQLGGEPSDAVTTISAVAQGDLSAKVKVTTGDSASVMAAMENMREQLTQLVAQVRQGVDGVATASGEIASGNADLSRRTEQQAAGLQAATQSMQQMMSSVSANAESARLAREMVAETASAAAAGGEVVSQVVSTMGEIQASSQRIGDIVSTIDGIAFQTNILALNAAVEAARAGDAGRGFAVVAAEVRALAQRSAGAAREVKSLIGASVERVEAGHRLVSDAGQRMQAIVQQVGRVNDFIGEIAASSQAQTEGISQVGAAVSQLDQTTQQNAALVEQSAAAAESLKHQAAQLASAASRFRLQGG